MKRAFRTGDPNPKPDRGKGSARAAWPPERHTGEGAASALENLQNQQRRRSLQIGEASPRHQSGKG